MRTSLLCVVVVAVVMVTVAPPARSAGSGVEVVRKDAERRVDVIVDGRPFTSYIWPEVVKKPILYPIRSARGTIVTRGYPLEPRHGERMDHPHQVGLWFNYGNVNGIDFWGNSEAIPVAERGKEGTIRHRSVVSTENGATRGALTTASDWVMPDGSTVLRQQSRYVFHAGASSRTIDLTFTLTAGDRRAVFADTKEGMLGLRVARALEAPSTEPAVFTDAAGHPTTVPAMDNAGITGEYLTSEGRKGDAAWGTRARWCLLSGTVDGERVAIAILDHPANPGHPTYWHARGYGLFAANPLGVKDFTEGKSTMDFAIEPHAAATFRYRVLVISGTPSAEDINRAWTEWAGSAR